MHLTVPEPCHADWSTMTLRPGGRLCSHCNHEVADLTNATDAELMALYRSGSGPKCARFHVSQVGRTLSSHSMRPARIPPIAVFTSLLALLTGCETITQGEPAIHVDQESTETASEYQELLKGPAHNEASDTAAHPPQDTTDRSMERFYIVGDVAIQPSKDQMDPWPIPREDNY